jgi:hypothetical protein
MLRAVIGMLLIPIGSLCGCGGSAPEFPVSSAPHGGKIVVLPNSHGFVELTVDRPAPSKGSRTAVVKSRIIAYFFQADGTTAMSPAPTDVKVMLGVAGSGTAVNLTPQSAEPGQFASEPGDYPDELRGQIEFQLNGKPVQATFSFR